MFDLHRLLGYIARVPAEKATHSFVKNKKLPNKGNT